MSGTAFPVSPRVFSMLDRIRNLAQFIKDKNHRGDKFVLMLGAGASLASGIKVTRALMEEIVDKAAQLLGLLQNGFDALVAGAVSPL